MIVPTKAPKFNISGSPFRKISDEVCTNLPKGYIDPIDAFNSFLEPKSRLLESGIVTEPTAFITVHAPSSKSTNRNYYIGYDLIDPSRMRFAGNVMAISTLQKSSAGRLLINPDKVRPEDIINDLKSEFGYHTFRTTRFNETSTILSTYRTNSKLRRLTQARLSMGITQDYVELVGPTIGSMPCGIQMFMPSYKDLIAKTEEQYRGKFSFIHQSDLEPKIYNLSLREGRHPISLSSRPLFSHDVSDHLFAGLDEYCMSLKQQIAQIAFDKKHDLAKSGSILDQFDGLFECYSNGDYTGTFITNIPIRRYEQKVDQNLLEHLIQGLSTYPPYLINLMTEITIAKGTNTEIEDIEMLLPFMEKVADRILENREYIVS